MTVQTILSSVEALTHAQRWTAMRTLGAQSVGDTALAASLAELARSSVHYHRLLALMSTAGSQDARLIAALLAEPSDSLAAVATRLAVLFMPTADLAALMPDMPRTRRRRLATSCVKAGRAEVNDAAWPTLDEDGQAHLLPLTTGAFLRQCLDADRIERLAWTDWALLARRFPGLVAEMLGRQLDLATDPTYALRSAVVAALRRLAGHAPATGLALLVKAARTIPANLLPCDVYCLHYPNEIATIVTAAGNTARWYPSATALQRLDPATLRALADVDALPQLALLFARLGPDQRRALYDARAQAWREASGALPLGYVAHLPAATRQKEARHAFAAPLLEAQPMARLPYLACLPFAEALALAQPFLSQPEGELRAQAIAALVGSGRYDSAALDAILDACIIRENEQDPVRLAMIGALADLPPSRWQAAHLGKLRKIFAAALRARDCSPATMAAIARFLLGIIVAHTAFVCEELPALVERLGHLSFLAWESRMTDAQMVRLAPSLLPLLQNWVARNRHGVAVGLITSFGRRAQAVPAFAALLRGLTDDGRGSVASAGLEGLRRLELWRVVADLIPKLVSADPSWISTGAVADHLHRRRQDLLTPFLQPRRLGGRFPSGSAAFLPAFHTGFQRWTEQQQKRYAAALVEILTSPKRSAWELYGTVARYAAMPSVDLAPLVQLARLDAGDAALRDKALEALGRADAGRGVATLVDALDDARGRVAIYALRHAVVAMPPQPALSLLERAPRAKVTVAKEILRLAGEFGGAAAFAFLMHFADGGALHPDVQIALLRAFWGHLDREGVWERFRAAATSDRAALARATIRIPQERLSAESRRSLSRHLALLLAHPDAQVRRETLERLVAMPVGGDDPTLRAATVALLDDADPAIVALTAGALLAGHARSDAAGLAATFATIRQPRGLEAIVTAYERRRLAGADGLEASAAALVEALLVRRWHAGLAIRLALSVSGPEAGVATLRRFTDAQLLHPGVVEAALGALASAAAGRTQRALQTAEALLRAATEPGLRRIGLGMLAIAGATHGWTTEERAALTAYRADGEAWIADTADLIEPPEAPAALPPGEG